MVVYTHKMNPKSIQKGLENFNKWKKDNCLIHPWNYIFIYQNCLIDIIFFNCDHLSFEIDVNSIDSYICINDLCQSLGNSNGFIFDSYFSFYNRQKPKTVKTHNRYSTLKWMMQAPTRMQETDQIKWRI